MSQADNAVEKFKELKRRAEAAKEAHVRCKTKLESVNSELGELWKEVSAKYGVQNIDDLKVLVEKYRREVDEGLDNLEKVLEDYKEVMA